VGRGERGGEGEEGRGIRRESRESTRETKHTGRARGSARDSTTNATPAPAPPPSTFSSPNLLLPPSTPLPLTTQPSFPSTAGTRVKPPHLPSYPYPSTLHPPL